MDNTQRAYIESFDRVEQFNNDAANAAILAGIPEYQEEVNGFTASKKILKAAVDSQNVDTGHIKSSKDLKKEEMADLIIVHNEYRARVKAAQTGNVKLEEQLKHSVSYLQHSDDIKAATHAKNLVTVMEENLSILTNVSSTDISTMRTAITAFENDSSKPAVAKELKKTSGTEIIKMQIPIINKHVDNMLMLQISYLYKSNAEFVNHFRQISQLIHTGVKHNHALFHIVDDTIGTAIAQANITGDGKTAVSDNEGNVNIEKAHTGNQNFTVQVAGYDKQNVTVHIKRGTINEVTVRMKKTV